MRLQNLIRVALKAMLKNKMRSLLTMLGIIIGVGSVIVMVAIGQGTQKQIPARSGAWGSTCSWYFRTTSARAGSAREGLPT